MEGEIKGLRGEHKIVEKERLGNLLFVNLYRICVPERRVARQKLVDEYTQSPPVNSRRMAFRLDDFWSQVLRRATQRISLPFIKVNKSSFITPVSPRGIRSNRNLLLLPSLFANPKSTNLICPSASKSRFSGFKSRYATPSRSCRNSRIRTISAA